MRAKIRESAVPYLLNYMRVFVYYVMVNNMTENKPHTIMVGVFCNFQHNVLLFRIKNYSFEIFIRASSPGSSLMLK